MTSKGLACTCFGSVFSDASSGGSSSVAGWMRLFRALPPESVEPNSRLRPLRAGASPSRVDVALLADVAPPGLLGPLSSEAGETLLTLAGSPAPAEVVALWPRWFEFHRPFRWCSILAVWRVSPLGRACDAEAVTPSFTPGCTISRWLPSPASGTRISPRARTLAPAPPASPALNSIFARASVRAAFPIKA